DPEHVRRSHQHPVLGAVDRWPVRGGLRAVHHVQRLAGRGLRPIESVGGYADLNTAFTAALQAKTVPDLVCFPEMQWLQFYFAGALTPLDPHFDEEWNLDIYLQNYVGEGKAGEETYVVPFARSTPLFYYNKTLFSDLGLPVDTQYTWSQLRELGSEIAGVQSSGQPVKTFAYSAGDGWYASSWLWAFDGEWSDGLTVMPDDAP